MQDFDTDQTSDLFYAVGFIVIHFAQIEKRLDMMVSALYQNADPLGRPRRIPKMLEPKLKYLSDSVNVDTHISNIKDDLLLFIDEVRSISDASE